MIRRTDPVIFGQKFSMEWEFLALNGFAAATLIAQFDYSVNDNNRPSYSLAGMTGL